MSPDSKTMAICILNLSIDPVYFIVDEHIKKHFKWAGSTFEDN